MSALATHGLGKMMFAFRALDLRPAFVKARRPLASLFIAYKDLHTHLDMLNCYKPCKLNEVCDKCLD